MPESARIFLLRHAQSTFQVQFESTGIDPGHHDARLSDLGRAQVETVSETVRQLAPDLVVTSPATRAIETVLGVFAGHTLPTTVVDASVRDRFAGDSCDYGRSPAELASEFPGFDFSRLSERWWLPSSSDAGERALPESRDEFAQRVMGFGRWLAAHKERSILVVGHLGTFRVLAGEDMGNCELRRWDPARLA